MDPTEDLSARVLLKHILSTQTPQTPVTNSSQSQEVSTSGVRRSSRQSRRRNAETKTPQDILRRSLRQNIRESITRKSQPPTERRTVSVMLTRVSSSASMLLSDGATPRHLLRNILQTDPVKSPVVHQTESPTEPEPQSADRTATRIHPSTELSELELPDITIGNVASVGKGLSRKRPYRNLNVTAFEKRLKAGKDIEEGDEDSSDDHSSLSLLSSTSLTLKTPFADVQTEKRGLQRKVFDRRKVSEEEFGAAVSKRQMGDVSSHGFVDGNLGEVTNSEGFTLGLSKLGEPDITADIVNCNTALYDQPDTMISGFPVVSTQDKSSVMSSQLQDIVDMEQEEELGKMAKDKMMDMFPSEEEDEEEDAAPTEVDENAPDVLMQEDVAEIQTEQSKNNVADDAEVMSKSEEEEAAAESETDETDDGAESQEVEAQTGEEGASDSHAEDDDKLDELTEEEEVSPDSQTKEEQEVAEAQEHVADSQSEDIESSHSEDEEDAQEPLTEHMAESVPFQGDEAEAHSEDEEGVATSQTEDEYDEQREEVEEEDQALEHLEQDSSHISRRARRSEGALVVPVSEVREDVADASEAGWSNSKSKAHTSISFNASSQMENHDLRRTRTGSLVSTKLSLQDEDDVSDTENVPAAGSKASFHHPELTQDIQVSGHKSTDSSEEDADQEDADQEDADQEDADQEDADQEDELGDDLDEEVEEFPCKTPAFVKEKKIFISDPAASPSVFKKAPASGTSEALPAAKPKQVRQRKTRTASKKGVLPKSYLMSTFRHFAKTKVSADVYPVLNEIMDAFFDRMVEDLETYAAHANRKTIEFEDAVLLLKRQGHVNDKIPVEVLIEKYLRMEQRKILIPIATSGNVVVPKMR